MPHINILKSLKVKKNGSKDKANRNNYDFV